MIKSEVNFGPKFTITVDYVDETSTNLRLVSHRIFKHCTGIAFLTGGEYSQCFSFIEENGSRCMLSMRGLKKILFFKED